MKTTNRLHLNPSATRSRAALVLYALTFAHAAGAQTTPMTQSASPVSSSPPAAPLAPVAPSNPAASSAAFTSYPYADTTVVEERWYGMPSVVVDGVAAAVLVAAAANSNSKTAVITGTVGVTLMNVGAPMVHLANGHGGRAFGSFMLRSIVPGVAAFAAMGSQNLRPFEIPSSVWVGCAIGGLAVAAFDDVLWSKKYVLKPKANATSIAVVPQIDPSGTYGVSVYGRM